MQLKVGIFGGTFDPIHLGHIEIAKAAMDEVGLSKVIFMVAGDPWQKSGNEEGKVSSAQDRFDMVCAAVENINGFEVSDMEIKREGKTYTVDTLTELAKTHESQLFFIIGSDVMGQLETWERPDEVKELTTFIVVERPNSALSSESQNIAPESQSSQEGANSIQEGANNIQVGAKAINIRGPYLDISATDIRERIKNSQEVESLLPSEVFRIIKEQRLYGE